MILVKSGLQSAVETADSITQLANFNTDSVIISPLSLSSMFNILNPMESADRSWPTIGVSRRQISLEVAGLKFQF